jgi:hypothetical protein
MNFCVVLPNAYKNVSHILHYLGESPKNAKLGFYHNNIFIVNWYVCA